MLCWLSLGLGLDQFKRYDPRVSIGQFLYGINCRIKSATVCNLFEQLINCYF